MVRCYCHITIIMARLSVKKGKGGDKKKRAPAFVKDGIDTTTTTNGVDTSTTVVALRSRRMSPIAAGRAPTLARRPQSSLRMRMMRMSP
jgi:hypothetical protein